MKTYQFSTTVGLFHPNSPAGQPPGFQRSRMAGRGEATGKKGRRSFGGVRWKRGKPKVPSTTCSSNGFKSLESEASHPYKNQGGYRHHNTTRYRSRSITSRRLRSPTRDRPHNPTRYDPHNPTRHHQRDLGPPRQRLRLSVHPSVRSRIQIMGSITPAPPLPHRRLHSGRCTRMAQDVPGARRESRPLRQGFTAQNGREFLYPRQFFRMPPVVYGRG